MRKLDRGAAIQQNWAKMDQILSTVPLISAEQWSNFRCPLVSWASVPLTSRTVNLLLFFRYFVFLLSIPTSNCFSFLIGVFTSHPDGSTDIGESSFTVMWRQTSHLVCISSCYIARLCRVEISVLFMLRPDTKAPIRRVVPFQTISNSGRFRPLFWNQWQIYIKSNQLLVLLHREH